MRLLSAIALAGCLTFVAAGTSFAADRLGNYVVRGVGIKSCVDYLEAEQTSQEAVQPYVWWIGGYISSLSLLMPETADSAPIRDLAVVAILTRNICRGDPSLRMETALGRLMRFFEPYRLRKLSPVVSVARPGGGAVEVYEETIIWVQQTLANEGLYDGAPDGRYGGSLRQALASYQEQRGLPVNGLPDAQTLQALFREFPLGPEASN